jgi:hypothetical protein
LNNNKYEDAKTGSKVFSDKVYFLGPELDSSKCQIEAACDCCSDDLVFLDDSLFLVASYCESNTSYSKGKYTIKRNTLVLKYDSIQVSEDYNDYNLKIDTLKGGIKNDTAVYTITKGRASVVEVAISVFKSRTVLKVGDKKTGIFYAMESDKSLQGFVKTLKEEKIWEKLEMK